MPTNLLHIRLQYALHEGGGSLHIVAIIRGSPAVAVDVHIVISVAKGSGLLHSCVISTIT